MADDKAEDMPDPQAETDDKRPEFQTGRVRRTLEDDEKRQRRAFLRKRRERVGNLEAEVERHDKRGTPSDKRPY